MAVSGQIAGFGRDVGDLFALLPLNAAKVEIVKIEAKIDGF